MKKQFFTAITLIAATALLTGCGDKSPSKTAHINPDKYVTLGDYENMTAEYEAANISDEEIENQINAELQYYIEGYDLYNYTATDKTEVEVGDVVNMDYEGLLDNVPFEGGTAEGAHLEIGSGRFIPGFEDGLIGCNVGDDIDLPLTFPEEYQSEELAGKDVIFKVKINSIDESEMPALDDELIQSLSIFGMPYTTMEEYRESVQSYLKEQVTTQNESLKTNAIWDIVYESCTVAEPPEELVTETKDRLYKDAEAYALQAGVDFDTFLTDNMQMSKEEFDEQAEIASIESAKEVLVMRAIAKKADITLSTKELEEAAAEEGESAGYPSAESYLEAIGESVYYDYLLQKKVYEHLGNVVSIKEI